MISRWPRHALRQFRGFSSGRANMAGSYAEAVTSLNTLQTNFAIIDAIRKSGRKLNAQAIPEMIDWLGKTGYKPSDLNSLNAIHIAGTKGKGSTAAFISSILGQYIGVSPATVTDGQTKSISKIGLYTSPHLRFVRERIQINGRPLSEEEFARYFFETWERLETSAQAAGEDAKDTSAKPVYFRFLTLMAFHAYMSEAVDAAIIECGIGGAYDSTNILESPTVTGITSLGIDHVGVLGGTIEEIAWHKAGIMKKGIKCFTPSSQNPKAKKVLERVASERGAELVYVDIDPDIMSGQVKLGLQADFQKTNASLAVAIAKEWLNQRGFACSEGGMDDPILRGLAQVHWPGRCETRTEKNVTWCIDGGHTLESITLAGQWFAQQILTQKSTSSQPSRVLIFNQQQRDADALVKALYEIIASSLNGQRPFTHAIFCTNTTFQETGFRPDLASNNTNASDLEALRVQRQLAETWSSVDPETSVSVVKTIEEAVGLARGLAEQETSTAESDEEVTKKVTVLVTGSLHLVGGFLEVIETEGAGAALRREV